MCARCVAFVRLLYHSKCPVECVVAHAKKVASTYFTFNSEPTLRMSEIDAVFMAFPAYLSEIFVIFRNFSTFFEIFRNFSKLLIFFRNFSNFFENFRFFSKFFEIFRHFFVIFRCFSAALDNSSRATTTIQSRQPAMQFPAAFFPPANYRAVTTGRFADRRRASGSRSPLFRLPFAHGQCCKVVFAMN